MNDVKDAVERIRSDLPATADEPIVSRIDVEGQAILTYAVSAPAMTIEELSWFVDDTVIRKLQGLKGVARVDRYGGVTREIKVELDPDRLNALRRHGGRRQPRAARRQCRPDRRQRRVRRAATRRSARSAAPRTIADLEALEIPLSGGRKVTALRHRHGDRLLGRAEVVRPRQRPDGRLLRRLPRQGRKRRRGQRARRGGDRRRCRRPIPTSPSPRSTIR